MSNQVIELENVDVKWVKINAFSKYELQVVKAKNNIGCGNPWNAMNENERKHVESLRPRTDNLVCGIDTLLHIEIIGPEKLKEDIEQDLGADVWGLFYTNHDRTETPTVYFDHRQDPAYDLEPNIRDKLMKDSTELVDLIKNKKTIVIVFGANTFLEIYYSMINNTIIKSTVNHTLGW